MVGINHEGQFRAERLTRKQHQCMIV